jgi:hypothetical protein
MKHSDVRKLTHSGDASDRAAAALALLRRSVDRRHKRLALIRCLVAQQLRADVPAGLQSYCDAVASRLTDAVIRGCVEQAFQIMSAVSGASSAGDRPPRHQGESSVR